MLTCAECGTEFAPDDAFCGNCGKPRPSAPRVDVPQTKPPTSATGNPRVFRAVIFGAIVVLLLAGGYWYWSRLPANDGLIHELMSAPLSSYVHTTMPLGAPRMLSADNPDPGQVGQVLFPARNLKSDEAVVVQVFRSNADARSSYDQSRRSDTSGSLQAGYRVNNLADGTGFCLGKAGRVFACRAVVGRAVATLVAPEGESQTVGANAMEAVVGYLELLPQ